jgi:hypothetical protein
MLLRWEGRTDVDKYRFGCSPALLPPPPPPAHRRAGEGRMGQGRSDVPIGSAQRLALRLFQSGVAS